MSYAVDRPSLARLWRTAARYVEARVGRLAAYVTYYGFLALFPLTALGFAVLGVLSRVLPELDDAVQGALADRVQDLGLSPEIVVQLQRAAVGLGLISLGLFLYAGVRLVESLREALAVVNGGQPPRGALARRLGADLVLLFVLGLVLVASVALSTLATASAATLADWLGVTSSQTLVRIGALSVSLLVSAVVVGVVLSRLAGRPLRGRLVVEGAVVGALGLEVLRALAALIIGLSLRNPVYGVFALTIGLLVWINATVKWLLVVATWVGVADDEGLGSADGGVGDAGDGHASDGDSSNGSAEGPAAPAGP